jgi:hypothetical protein
MQVLVTGTLPASNKALASQDPLVIKPQSLTGGASLVSNTS